jgi:uncharacterized membrane protein YdjX (TVP38/TMEM64 family)
MTGDRSDDKTDDRGPIRAISLALGADGSGHSRWHWLAGLAALVACGIAFFFVVQAIGPERLRDAVAAAGPLAPIFFVLLKAITIVVTPISGTPLRLAAGTLFGFWPGVALTILGSVLGGSANFWIARTYGRRMVARLLGQGALAKVEPLLGRLLDWRALALARVVLAPLWDVLSYGVGLTRLRFGTYLAVAFLGDVIPTMILVGVGTSVAEVGMVETGAAGAQAVEAAVPVALTVVAAGLGSVLLIVVGMLLRPRLARRLSQPAPRPTIIPGALGTATDAVSPARASIDDHDADRLAS